MTRRDRTAYADMSAARPRKVFTGQDVTTPTAGYFRFKMGANTVQGGVRIWFGPPHDPVTGEELDRSWRWQAMFDGEPVDFDRVWPACVRKPISEADYRAYVNRRQWARENAPGSAYAERGRKIDLLSIENPLPF